MGVNKVHYGLSEKKIYYSFDINSWYTPGCCDCLNINPIVPAGNSCFLLTMTFVKNNDHIKKFNEVLAGRELVIKGFLFVLLLFYETSLGSYSLTPKGIVSSAL